MPPPRLLPGSRRPGPSGRPSASADPSHPVLPPYESPSHPLNELGKRSLAELANSRETHQYNAHLTKSASHLRDAVGAINDVLILRRNFLASLSERRQKRGDDEKTELETQIEEEVARMEEEVKTLTERAEAAIREVIDARAELEDEARVLEMVVRGAASQKPRREKVKKERRPRRHGRHGREDSDEDGLGDEEPEDVDMRDGEQEDDAPITGLVEMLKSRRKTTKDEYDRLTVQQKYGQNNEYIAFKKTWHDSVHQVDQIPLPDASTWFDEQGRPVQDHRQGADDDDLVIEREIIDLKCPLSLQIMKEPFSNHRCKHTFEKSAIVDFLSSSGGAGKCPVCTKELRLADFFLDELILRKLKRAREAEQQRQEDEDEDEDGSDNEDADQSIIPGRSVNIKSERARGRRVAEGIDDSE